jgi:hypothetical protein
MAGPLHDPDRLDTIRDNAVQDEITAHGKIPTALGDIRTCWPKLWVNSQQGALILDLIKHVVRPRRPSDTRHVSLVPSASGYSGALACSKRRLASAMIACISTRWPGPLSIPSSHACRNSSSSF